MEILEVDHFNVVGLLADENYVLTKVFYFKYVNSDLVKVKRVIHSTLIDNFCHVMVGNKIHNMYMNQTNVIVSCFGLSLAGKYTQETFWAINLN